jgi:hypothetical protein
MICRLKKLTQRDSESCKRMSKLSGLENNTFRYNNMMKYKLKAEEKNVDGKHEEELESWADKFCSSGERER